ncbi:hypothetical protein DERF_005545 [Dermatophagoides farinae]|uniref:Uncharacterized protein n=1 Tax=Dermatophagoides farinae TaxID=6954 RepID=A0A922I3P0_DERFA|nr:hypothetical protein DERF_005545 [Dermatophagoides farinae]
MHACIHIMFRSMFSKSSLSSSFDFKVSSKKRRQSFLRRRRRRRRNQNDNDDDGGVGGCRSLDLQ